MIVVIADDLTGAAELAGIGLRYGIDVEMCTVVDKDSTAELLVVATDTRSMKEDDAITEAGRIAAEVLLLKPEIVYKKIDSVLRRYVLAELNEQLKVLNLKQSLVVAANPALGRTISDGTFYYNDEPIHLSSFSKDPEFAITTSNVLEMLKIDDRSVKLVKKNSMLPGGIMVGEVKNSRDLKVWAKRIENNMLPAGASGFFSAILELYYPKKNKGKNGSIEYQSPSLFICGTTFNKSRNAIKKIVQNGGPVSYMPEAVVVAKNFDIEIYQLWANEIIAFIHSEGKAIISIDPGIIDGIPVSAKELREKTAMVVKEVCEQINIHEFFIEGGSTAAAVIRQLEFQTFIPVEELAPGVVRMQVKEKQDISVTVKPGSYDWPDEVWNF